MRETKRARRSWKRSSAAEPAASGPASRKPGRADRLALDEVGFDTDGMELRNTSELGYQPGSKLKQRVTYGFEYFRDREDSAMGGGPNAQFPAATAKFFGGFVQVRPDRVVVLAETADIASDIDLERAQRARREAQNAIDNGFVEAADLASARAALQRALIRIRLAERGPRQVRGEHEGPRPRVQPRREEPPGE